jgi:hypothetical protein
MSLDDILKLSAPLVSVATLIAVVAQQWGRQSARQDQTDKLGAKIDTLGDKVTTRIDALSEAHHEVTKQVAVLTSRVDALPCPAHHAALMKGGKLTT